MATNDTFREPIGTKDIIGDASRIWQSVITQFGKIAHQYNYDLAINPTFENYEVFTRLGQDTDVVTKEMYDFYDKGERHIALRPEGTAGLVRSVAQHRPIMPFKAWYFVSNFRYERPQKGRLREHHQLGIEALGSDDPAVDVEVIMFAHEFLRACGLREVTLLINSLGDNEARAKHNEELVKYLAQFEGELGEEFTQRSRKNPFRVLDTKVPEWLDVAKGAPKILDYLSPESKERFEYVQSELTLRSIDFTVQSSLVRGLDYYTDTAFEFVSTALDAAQSTVCGGGRYNKLVAEMGGPETPGIGFGLGVERLLLAMEAENAEIPTRRLDAIFIDLAHTPDSRKVIRDALHAVRESGASADQVFGGKSMKAAFKNADRSGATWAIVVGDGELERGVITAKNMQSGEQQEIAPASITDFLT